MSHEDGLNELRKKIDNIDIDIIKLLNQRVDYVEEVGEIKSLTNNGINDNKRFIRSGREIKMLYPLLQAVNKKYSYKAIINIWRSIISSSLRLESRLNIHSYFHIMDQACYWLAREYFVTSDIKKIEDYNINIIDYYNNINNEVDILVMPDFDYPNKWWRFYLESNNKDVPKVFANINYDNNDQEANCFALSYIEPEATGSDNSLFIVKKLSKVNVDHKIISEFNNYYLIVVEKFTKILDNISSEYQYIGSYCNNKF